MTKTLFGYDSCFLEHLTGEHPEGPDRLVSIVEAIEKNGMTEALLPVKKRVAVDPWIQQIHTKDYIERFRLACENGETYIDSAESAICPKSYEIARVAVSVTLAACDMIMAGEANNGFCALRPPGHHAEVDKSMGFCMFNNIAIACKYLQKHHGLKRILILDWDVHHGNGTQNSFERDPSVLFCSFHQHPATLFPGTGWPQEQGEGLGRGFTLNLPLEPGSGDSECMEQFQRRFLPKAHEFMPEFILVSAGFDGHIDDPMAELAMTDTAFDAITLDVMEIANKYCKGRVLSILEGGYDLETLGRCVVKHIKCMM
ncbi:MAG: histone deacetylase [Phycisphaerae bacterium]|nr:histone deacetylase [Phycisphaerae bacterium]